MLLVFPFYLTLFLPLPLGFLYIINARAARKLPGRVQNRFEIKGREIKSRVKSPNAFFATHVLGPAARVLGQAARVLKALLVILLQVR